MTAPEAAASARWHLFVPKLYTVLRQGYSLEALRDDVIAGLTVAIVALPLAMALAIASGTRPSAASHGHRRRVPRSALGGSRFQVGGPTGAFVVVVFNVIAQHGYDGLVIATLMAGLMLVAAGLMRLGTILKTSRSRGDRLHRGDRGDHLLEPGEGPPGAQDGERAGRGPRQVAAFIAHTIRSTTSPAGSPR